MQLSKYIKKDIHTLEIKIHKESGARIRANALLTILSLLWRVLYLLLNYLQSALMSTFYTSCQNVAQKRERKKCQQKPLHQRFYPNAHAVLRSVSRTSLSPVVLKLVRSTGIPPLHQRPWVEKGSGVKTKVDFYLETQREPLVCRTWEGRWGI